MKRLYFIKNQFFPKFNLDASCIIMKNQLWYLKYDYHLYWKNILTRQNFFFLNSILDLLYICPWLYTSLSGSLRARAASSCPVANIATFADPCYWIQKEGNTVITAPLIAKLFLIIVLFLPLPGWWCRKNTYNFEHNHGLTDGGRRRRAALLKRHIFLNPT